MPSSAASSAGSEDRFGYPATFKPYQVQKTNTTIIESCYEPHHLLVEYDVRSADGSSVRTEQTIVEKPHRWDTAYLATKSVMCRKINADISRRRLTSNATADRSRAPSSVAASI